MPRTSEQANNYARIAEKIFMDGYRPGVREIEFDRDEIPNAAEALGVPLADCRRAAAVTQFLPDLLDA